MKGTNLRITDRRYLLTNGLDRPSVYPVTVTNLAGGFSTTPHDNIRVCKGTLALPNRSIATVRQKTLNLKAV